jgi:hypothetical protein
MKPKYCWFIIPFMGLVVLMMLLASPAPPARALVMDDNQHVQLVVGVWWNPNGGVGHYEIKFRDVPMGYWMIGAVFNEPGHVFVSRLQDWTKSEFNPTMCDGSLYESELREAIEEWNRVGAQKTTWGKVRVSYR